jgi:hypothetical protein
MVPERPDGEDDEKVDGGGHKPCDEWPERICERERRVESDVSLDGSRTAARSLGFHDLCATPFIEFPGIAS